MIVCFRIFRLGQDECCVDKQVSFIQCKTARGEGIQIQEIKNEQKHEYITFYTHTHIMQIMHILYFIIT